jgi:transposase
MDNYFGADVSKAKLDIGGPGDDVCKVANKAADIRKFLKGIPKGSVIAVEATGGYGHLLANEAYKAGMTVYLVQPGKVKKFRESSPARGKTDKLDAIAIREYILAYHHRLHPYTPLPEFEAKLRKLARTRGALVEKLASIRKQLRSLGDAEKDVSKVLKGLEDRIEDLDEVIAALLKQDKDVELLLSVPGVGPCFVSAVLPALRTIQFKSKHSLDSYFGIDLIPNESGPRKGRKRMSKQGDKYARHLVYMAGFSGANAKVWKPYYQALLEETRLQKIQAMNALGRKILHTAYGVYTTKTKFDPKKLTKQEKATTSPES